MPANEIIFNDITHFVDHVVNYAENIPSYEGSIKKKVVFVHFETLARAPPAELLE